VVLDRSFITAVVPTPEQREEMPRDPTGTLQCDGMVVALGHVVKSLEAALHVFSRTDSVREGCVMCANLGACPAPVWMT
jgi:hypothetical protein